jgi:hypothetical protein
MLSEELGIGLNLQSHSLRKGYITRTLNVRDVYNTAMMVRHKSLSPAQRYNRYTLKIAKFKEIRYKVAQIGSEINITSY